MVVCLHRLSLRVDSRWRRAARTISRARSVWFHTGVVLVASVCALTASAEPQLKLGVMGDSLSDEYFENPTRAYAKNWLQQVAENRAIDPGPTAVAAGQPQRTWGPPRETGYAFNWSSAWATARSLLASGQATGLASQVAADGIGCAVLAIGANDFNPYSGAYAGIYDGTWSAARIQVQELRTLANIKTALVTVRRTGVPLILVNILDSGSTPALMDDPFFANATKRQRVTSVINDINRRLRQLAQTYQVPLVDWFGLAQSMAGSPTNLAPVLLLGNTPIKLQQTDPGPGLGANPTAGYVADGFHPHTTIQGVLANAIITALDSGAGANLPVFTEAEILQHAGLTYGGVDTLLARIGSYTNYVFLPVPLGPTGTYQLTISAVSAGPNPAANWSLQIDIHNKVNSRNARPTLTAGARTILPGGDTIIFSEVAARYARQTGYTLVFTRGTNVTVSPPRPAVHATLVVRNLTFIPVDGNWQPHGGKITYRQGTEILAGVVD